MSHVAYGQPPHPKGPGSRGETGPSSGDPRSVICSIRTDEYGVLHSPQICAAASSMPVRMHCERGKPYKISKGAEESPNPPHNPQAPKRRRCQQHDNVVHVNVLRSR